MREQLISDALLYFREVHGVAPLPKEKKKAEVVKLPDPPKPVVKAVPPPQPQPKKVEEVSWSSSLRAEVAAALPEMRLTSTIPDDSAARSKAKQYAAVILLSFDPGELAFFKALGEAIMRLPAPVQIIDGTKLTKENRWPSFLEERAARLFIAEERALDHSAHALIKNAGKPLILLAPIPEYAKNPSLKRLLWSKICHQLSQSS